jgi:hypothetical protein
MTTPTIDDLRAELDAIRAELRNPKIGLFRSRALYRRMGEVWRMIDDLEKEPQP